MTHHDPPATHPTQEYVVPRSKQGVSYPSHYAEFMRRSLTNTDDGSIVGLLVLISVDRNGAQENESQNGEERERHRAEEVSALSPRRVTGRTRDHDEEKERERRMSKQTRKSWWGFYIQ